MTDKRAPAPRPARSGALEPPPEPPATKPEDPAVAWIRDALTRGPSPDLFTDRRVVLRWAVPLTFSFDPPPPVFLAGIGSLHDVKSLLDRFFSYHLAKIVRTSVLFSLAVVALPLCYRPLYMELGNYLASEPRTQIWNAARYYQAGQDPRNPSDLNLPFGKPWPYNFLTPGRQSRLNEVVSGRRRFGFEDREAYDQQGPFISAFLDWFGQERYRRLPQYRFTPVPTGTYNLSQLVEICKDVAFHLDGLDAAGDEAGYITLWKALLACIEDTGQTGFGLHPHLWAISQLGNQVMLDQLHRHLAMHLRPVARYDELLGTLLRHDLLLETLAVALRGDICVVHNQLLAVPGEIPPIIPAGEGWCICSSQLAAEPPTELWHEIRLRDMAPGGPLVNRLWREIAVELSAERTAIALPWERARALLAAHRNARTRDYQRMVPAEDRWWDLVTGSPRLIEFRYVVQFAEESALQDRRWRTREAGMEAGLALLRERAVAGRWPEVAGTLSNIPSCRDLFTGKPFVYQKTGDMAFLYSAGRNGRDDHRTGDDFLVWSSLPRFPAATPSPAVPRPHLVAARSIMECLHQLVADCTLRGLKWDCLSADISTMPGGATRAHLRVVSPEPFHRLASVLTVSECRSLQESALLQAYSAGAGGLYQMDYEVRLDAPMPAVPERSAGADSGLPSELQNLLMVSDTPPSTHMIFEPSRVLSVESGGSRSRVCFAAALGGSDREEVLRRLERAVSRSPSLVITALVTTRLHDREYMTVRGHMDYFTRN